MLPEFEAATDLLKLELAPFVKYGRVPFVDVSAKSELIHIRVTVQKTSAKAVSFNWINEAYKVTSTGGLFFNDGYEDKQIACDADRIAAHFLTLHKAKITDRFEKLLPE